MALLLYDWRGSLFLAPSRGDAPMMTVLVYSVDRERGFLAQAGETSVIKQKRPETC
jgi:hypothetical protein